MYGGTPPQPGVFNQGSQGTQTPYGTAPSSSYGGGGYDPSRSNPALGTPPPMGAPMPGYYGAPGTYPAGYPGGFGAGQGYGMPPTMPRPNHNLAIGALVLGIVTCAIVLFSFASVVVFPGCCIVISPIGVVTGIIGLVLGVKSRKEIKANPDKYQGDGFAFGGIIMSAIGLGINVLLIILGIIVVIMFYMMLTSMGGGY